MARYEHLPIWRSAMDLALGLGLEQAVAGSPRAHRFALGAKMRRSAQQILGGVMRCARARGQREGEVERLILLIEQAKVQLALARELKVFASFQHFARAAEQVVSLGKQSEGWLRPLADPITRHPVALSTSTAGVL
jgi:hypothetical protein